MMNVVLLTTLGLLLVAIITRYSSLREMMIQYFFLSQLSPQTLRDGHDGSIVPGA